MLDRIVQQCIDHGLVIGNHAKAGVVTGLGNRGVRGCRRDVGNIAVVVDLGRRQGCARLQVANHTRHFLVAKALGQGRSLTRVTHIVARLQLPLHRATADLQLARIEFINGHAHAVFFILAQGRNRAGNRPAMGNAHHQRLVC